MLSGQLCYDGSRKKVQYGILTQENIEQEHICCAIASEKDPQVHSKKTWLKEQMNNGLIFTKMNVRGKCFIEYLPLEYAWVPIQG